MSDQYLNVQASILDRLIDSEPRVSSEPVQNHLQGVGPIKNSVVRHLEKLLNTRRYIETTPAELREINKSLFVYGLKDFTGENPNSIMIPFGRHGVLSVCHRHSDRIHGTAKDHPIALSHSHGVNVRTHRACRAHHQQADAYHPK